MKKLLFTLICLQSVFTFGQDITLEWVKQMGEVGASGTVNAITVDDLGNVYTTGYFQGTIDFDPGPGISSLVSSGGFDIFIQKLDGAGNFLWAKQIGGMDNDVANSITVDASGNVYTTGYFSGTVDFNPGTGTYNLASLGYSDIFVQKLNSSGNFVWAKRMGGTDHDRGRSIAVDASGNVYTTGEFTGTVDFNPGAGTYNLVSSGGFDIFIQKLDGAGNFLWAKQMGGTSGDYANYSVLDNLGNLYITGSFRGTVDFDPGAGVFNLVSAGEADIFISKLDESGGFLWTKQAGGNLTDDGSSIAVDASGNVYTTGSFRGTVDFDPGAGVFNLTSAGENDIFISKLDESGDFMWAKQIGGTDLDWGTSIAVDASGNVYTTGEFRGTIDFDSETGTSSLISAGWEDVFIQKLNSSGNFLWIKQIGGAGTERGVSTIDETGSLYTGGRFQSVVDFDPEIGVYNLTSNGTSNLYVQKLTSYCVPSYETLSHTACGSFTWTDGDGETYNSSTTASYTFVGGAVNGCDSIVTLNLTINQPTSSIITETVCGSYTLNGQTYTSSGTYTQVIPNANNCDSTITLNLTINQATTHTITETACGSYTLNSQTYTSSGTYTQMLTSSNNCDSTITLNLTINNVDNTVSESGIILTANQAGGTYQWIDCNNGNSPVSGATSQSFEPTANGNYAVEVTANGCTEASNCILVNSVGIESLEQNGWNVYPNPTNGVFTITSTQTLNNAVVEVYSSLGQLVYSNVYSGNNIVINLGEQPNGVYILRVNKEQNVRVIKF